MLLIFFRPDKTRRCWQVWSKENISDRYESCVASKVVGRILSIKTFQPCNILGNYSAEAVTSYNLQPYWRYLIGTGVLPLRHFTTLCQAVAVEAANKGFQDGSFAFRGVTYQFTIREGYLKFRHVGWNFLCLLLCKYILVYGLNGSDMTYDLWHHKLCDCSFIFYGFDTQQLFFSIYMGEKGKSCKNLQWLAFYPFIAMVMMSDYRDHKKFFL